MKKIAYINLIILFLFTGCMTPVDVEVDLIPDTTDITSISVGLMGENGIFQPLTDTFKEIDKTNKSITVHLKTFMSMESIWVSTRLESGCSISSVDGAPSFGTYGDYTVPRKYRVTSSTGTSSEWTVTIMPDPNLPDISCLAGLWTGDGLVGKDVPYPSYSPATTTGEKIDGDCNKIKITYDFWQDGNGTVVLELELGEFDESTFKGSVTLLKSVSFSSYGYDMTYEAGPAGTYNLNTLELNFDAAFSGYGSSGSYPMTFYKE